jgi:site-specific DNA recombinase
MCQSVHNVYFTVMSAVAKLERDLINERTQGGRRAKAANGGYAYGSPAFGQVAVEGDLMPKSDELEVVELIRRHHKSGKSFQAIASWLNEKGHKTKRGCHWQAMSVKRVVDRLYPKAA